jgi:small subunit ribosomal protein S2
MGGLPDLVFVIDTNKEDIAIKEARRLNVPVAAVVDTNCDPDGITYVVPGNDDASRAITLYCDLIAKAAIDGISRAQGAHGIDVGAQAEPVVEELPPEKQQAWFRAAVRAARRRRRPQEASRRVADDREEAQRSRHLPLLADRRTFFDAAHNVGEEVGLPGRVEGWIARAKEQTRPSESSPGRREAASPGIHRTRRAEPSIS